VSVKPSWEKLRPWTVYLMAASVPISLAATSIFKVLMLLVAVAMLIAERRRATGPSALTGFYTPVVILVMIAALSLSLLYTPAPLAGALVDLGKYGKLLVIPAVLMLIRSRREAMIALAAYIGSETFVLLSSYLLSLDLTLFWVPKGRTERLSIGTVYSSYIDQSIMTAGLAVLCWHLRDEFPTRYGKQIAIGIMIAAAVNVLFLLPGRSGHVALLVALGVGLYWAVPGRGRPAALIAPVLILAAATAVSPEFRGRLSAVVSESQAYSRGDPTLTSSGMRLNFWERSVEALREKPLTGYGIGSWNHVYTHLEGTRLTPRTADVRNPHQEYLLWGVQLGLGGIALLLVFMGTLIRDSLTFTPKVRHSLLSLVAIFAAVCLFNSTLFDALIGDYFCLLPALLLALGMHSPKRQDVAT
jgi:O-antigen ligase